MAEEMKKEIMIISEENIRDKIYTVRGQKVMLDFELAAIYGYTTSRFNEQVTNNIDKFKGDEFCFRLTAEEFKNLISKKSTSSWGGRRKPPRAFSESGIYMLMTVLKGDLAVRQSRALIRLFKRMKDYLSDNYQLISQEEINRLTVENSAQISEIERDLRNVRETMATKDDLSKFMNSFMDEHIGKELLFMAGKMVESDVAYSEKYSQAKKTVYIVDKT